MVVHRLNKDEARRIAIRAQLLDAPRPTDPVDVVDRLTPLQIDRTAAIAPSADLVLWSRPGPTYDPPTRRPSTSNPRSTSATGAGPRRSASPGPPAPFAADGASSARAGAGRNAGRRPPSC